MPDRSTASPRRSRHPTADVDAHQPAVGSIKAGREGVTAVHGVVIVDDQAVSGLEYEPGKPVTDGPVELV
jgi:hypothetical protein